MAGKSLLSCVKQLKRPVFTTSELAAMSGKSLSAATQGLNFLEKEGLIFKIYRGVWAESGNDRLSAYSAIPLLFAKGRAYVSFISALHIYGILEQIPQVITLASMSHTKVIKTKLGVFSVHRLDPMFFCGYGWYKETGDFLIAEQEKALIDSIYLSACKKRQFGYFPELRFPKSFSFKKAKNWAKKIPNPRIRLFVEKKLRKIQNA